MRKILLASVFSLGLSACVTPSGNVPGPGIDVGAVIQTAQETVAKVCGFVPEGGVISSLLVFFKPDAAGYLAMAQEICAALNTPKARRRGAVVTVRGVVIKGRYVR
jgi:hypothetical protein